MTTSKYVLCDCEACSKLEDIDPITKKKVKGVFLPESTARKHKATDLQVKKEAAIRASLPRDSDIHPGQKQSTSGRDDHSHSIKSKDCLIAERNENIEDSRKALTSLRDDIEQRCLLFGLPPSVTFRKGAAVPYDLDTIPSLGEILECNIDDNIKLISLDNWLLSAVDAANEIDCFKDPGLLRIRTCIERKAVNARCRIAAFVREEHTRRNPKRVQVDGDALWLDTHKSMSRGLSTQSDPILFITALIVAILKVLCFLSRDRSRFILLMMHHLIDRVVSLANPGDKVLQASASSAIPKDVRTVEKFFDLDPVYQTYISCPGCHALYPTDNPKPSDTNSAQFDGDTLEQSQYYSCETSGTPEFCTYKDADGEECGTRLLHPIGDLNGGKKPIRVFLCQDFSAWLCAFLSRPEIEEMVSKPLRNLTSHNPQTLSTVWDGPVVRNFLGPDELPFFRIYGSELRLLFAVCFNNLNPFHNKSAGKQVLIGALYLKCLNLDPEIQDLQENIFVLGIFPGPNAPSLTQINHYLKLLVDVFVKFWSPRFYLSRTHLYDEGRLARGAIIPFIMDLHAIRQMMGTGSHNSTYFCTFCNLVIQDIDNVDPTTWPPPCTAVEHRKLADLWLNADSQKTRKQLFKGNGIRWTELFKLPYFSHTINTMIDPMHGFQNVFRSHVRQIWRIDHVKPSGDGLFVRSSKKLEKEIPPQVIINALLGFQANNTSILDTTPKAVLIHLSAIIDKNLRRTGNKPQIISNLKKYFDDNPSKLKDVLKTVRTQTLSPSDVVTSLSPEVCGALALLSSFKEEDESARNVLKWYSRKVFQTLCQEVGLDFGKRDSKDLLIDSILRERHRLPVVSNLPLPLPDLDGGAVLGSDMVKEINLDYSRTVLPSWVSPGPKTFNSSKHGKLSAYEWRTTALVRLAISLPRVWGPRGGRHMEMLANYMHLLNAAIIASYRIVVPSTASSGSTAALYREEYRLYLEGRVRLYPAGKIEPTEHLMYHGGDQMDKMGPWPNLSTNVFERYNGRLQDTLTNMRIGEIEGTLFRQFCKEAKLRALLNDWENVGLPQHLHEEFEAVFNVVGKSNLLDSKKARFNSPMLGDLARMKTAELDTRLMKLLRQSIEVDSEGSSKSSQPYARYNVFWELQKCKRHGITFTAAGFNKPPTTPEGRFHPHRDSHILVKDSKVPVSKPHSIQKIFAERKFDPQTQQDGLHIYMLVRAYKELSPEHIEHDHWRQFPISGGRLYEDSLTKGSSRIISLSSVVGHFAKTPYEAGAINGINVPTIHVLLLTWHHAFHDTAEDLFDGINEDT